MQPERIGDYAIERKIGSGGMGTVYYGTHVETGEPAAIKMLPASMAREEGFVARFTREIESTSRLANPHVVTVFDSGFDDDAETYYYAMEYVDGETLTARLHRDRRIPWRETIGIAIQICSALKAAHDAGVIHRDLKPSNLMLAKDGTVKLTDFGVAQVFAGGKLTVTGGIIGTAEYMSPEQAQGRRASKKSDLYSLGAVMYVMLTGRPPFTGKTTLEVIQQHKFGQFDRPGLYADEIPRWLDEAVCQLLEKDPDKRFPDAFVLSRKLQEIVNKVDYALLQETRTVQPGSVGASANTASVQATAGNGGAPAMDAGGGTLMRDLVRAEIESAQAPSAIGRLFNNTWVLLGLLVLVVAGVVYAWQSRNLAPEEHFAAGAALMKQPEGPDWLVAREKHFDPLLEADAETWGPKVRPYLNRISVYELKTRLKVDSRRTRLQSPPASSEPERILRLAEQYRQSGDLARAESTLAALSRLLEDQPDQAELRELAEAMLESVRTMREELSGMRELLDASMQRADALAQDGRTDDARAVWRGVIEIYAGDPQADSWVRRARQRLAEIGENVENRDTPPANP